MTIQTATGVLEELSELDSDMVEACVPVLDVDFGAILVESGKIAPSLIWIVSGEVVLQLDGIDVASAGRGDVVGAAQALGDAVWQVSAKAIAPTRLLLVDRASLLSLEADGNPFAAKLERAALGTMARQTKAVNALIAARSMREDLPPPAATGFGRALRALIAGRPAAVDVAEALREARLFEGESDPAIDALAGSFTAVTVPRGNALTVQGDVADRVLLLLDGAVDAFVAAGDDQVARLGSVQPGTMIGLSAGIPPMTHAVTRIATEEVQALAISAEDFNDLIEARTQAGAALRRAAILARHDALAGAYERLRHLHSVARSEIRSSLEAMGETHVGGK